jgi:hypothetical protein
MGVVVQEVIFDAPAPTAVAIAARVAELVGLPLITRDAPSGIRGSFRDLHAHIAFEAHPDAEIELTAYSAGAVRQFLRRTGVDTMPMASHVQGVNEAEGKQTVYVRGYVGQEPTLFFATTLALEQLGGLLREPIPENVRREYGHSISSAELSRRHRTAQKHMLLTFAASLLLLPILVPVWTVMALITMPYRIWKAQQVVKKHRSCPPASGA